MFKRIRESFEKRAQELHQSRAERSAELLNELCEHLRQIGVNGTVHVSENLWESMGGGLLGNVAGYVAIEGRNIDVVQVEIEQHELMDQHEMDTDDVSYTVFYYHYIVRANVEGFEERLVARVNPIKKGFLSRKVVDFRWEGEDLAQRLNGDAELRTMLLREGLNQLPDIEVRAHSKPRRVPGIGKPPQAFFDAQDKFKQCVRITKHPRISSSSELRQGSIQVGGRGFRFGIGMQEMPRVGGELPTREAFDIYDRIAGHIRSITDAR